MAGIYNEDDSSEDEISVNLRLAQRLRINRDTVAMEDTALEDGKEIKQNNRHQKYFAANGQSSSSSSIELQSDNTSGVNSSDHFHNKKRQNGDKNLEQLANPKRTCLSDRIHKGADRKEAKKKGNSCKSHSKVIKGVDLTSANLCSGDSDSDFELPFKSTKKLTKTNEHILEKPLSSSSTSSVDSVHLRSFENIPSTSKFSLKGLHCQKNNELKSDLKNGALKGGRQESCNQSYNTKRLFSHFKKNKILDSDDSPENTPRQTYRTKPLIFTSSESETDFTVPSSSQNKFGSFSPNRTNHTLNFDKGYERNCTRNPRSHKFFQPNHKPNKKAYNALSSSKADSSDGCDFSISSDFQCKTTAASRSGRARRSPRVNIAANITTSNGFSNGNSLSAPIRGRRVTGADMGSRHSGSPHYRNNASRDGKNRGRSSSSRIQREKNNLAARHSDLYDPEESENEFFTANSYSDTETSTESLSGVTINASFPNHVGTISCSIDCDRDGTSDDEVRVVFSTGPSTRIGDTRRGASRTLGRRLQRGTPHRQPHNSVHEVVSLSPDPVEQVRQMEEDERMARMLQAQFDAEVDPDYIPTPSVLFPAEPQEDSDNIEEEIIEPDGESSDSDVEPSSTMHYSVQPFSGISVGPPRFMLNRLSRPQSFTHNTSSMPAVYFGNTRRYSRNRRRIHNAFGPPREGPEFQIARLFGLGIPGMGDIFSSGGEDYEALLSLDLAEEAVSRGLHKSDINRLPTRKFVHPNSVASASSSEANHKRAELNKECQVCLTDYETGDILRILPCFHEFHTPCIDPWLKINHTCPVCRVKVDLDS